ncbi:hypothetical protein ACWKW9_18720 [Rhizobium daejeonense]
MKARIEFDGSAIYLAGAQGDPGRLLLTQNLAEDLTKMRFDRAFWHYLARQI